MKKLRDDIMGMPISLNIVGAREEDLDKIFLYFQSVDRRFSTYKEQSEIMKINRGELKPDAFSEEMREIFFLAEQTKNETNGFFSIEKSDGQIDPSGIVKGWAIQKAAALAEKLGYFNYFIDAGGDIQSRGHDDNGKDWIIGIRNPFNEKEIVKVVSPKGHGVATSGTSVRGQHIYNPHQPQGIIDNIVSTTVIGPNIYEADRFATAAFAMGQDGINFIERFPGLECYQIDRGGMAAMTSNFESFVL